MPRTPLTREQAEEIVTRWLQDQLPIRDPGSRPDPAEVPGWLRWHESDLAFVVDVDLPAELESQLAALTVRMPRLDVPSGDDQDDSLIEAPVDPSELRLVVDRYTAEVAVAGRGEPISHVLELWRGTKNLRDEEAGSVPGYEPAREEQ